MFKAEVLRNQWLFLVLEEIWITVICKDDKVDGSPSRNTGANCGYPYHNAHSMTGNEMQKQFITQSSIKSESHLSGSQSRTEHKVTTTVCAIVTCFTITQGPSAVIRVMAVYYPIQHEFMIAVQSVITTMVVLGKALNFVLFCLSSANFRARLLQQARRGLLKKETRIHFVSLSSTNDCRKHGPKTACISTITSFQKSVDRSSPSYKQQEIRKGQLDTNDTMRTTKSVDRSSPSYKQQEIRKGQLDTNDTMRTTEDVNNDGYDDA
ncbi:hypothetical protein ANCCEY_04564 [Ancylostoma ceylanicum]|uniref:G-protein coupled receptors family 1 profile domain-containing protein n=1 Tax=Ancylostoma ceylanicum TaxID=53326 RepID=A0A0D6M941_9BILA|nr:hypothetical protein ANCCEY_04564 [Ancylostoma ceylanicum]